MGGKLPGSNPAPTKHQLTEISEYARSGLRLDMGSLIEPTVFSNDWKCGDTLSARSVSGKLVERDNIMACKVKSKRGVKVGRSVSGRQSEWHFFEKRAGATCDSMMKLKKRQEAFSFELPPLAEAIPGYNVITPTGDHAYARIPGGMYNEMFFDQAAASGLMNLGAQHNVRIFYALFSLHQLTIQTGCQLSWWMDASGWPQSFCAQVGYGR